MTLWGGTIDASLLAFTVGTDPQDDLALIPYDCMASIAHAHMLQAAGLLTAQQRQELADALRILAHSELSISAAQEDCHTAIEEALVARLGDTGRRIHTGRSRNDQVIMAMRLLIRHRLLCVGDAAIELARTLLRLAERYRGDPMPGYTHTRQAMPSTLGHLFAATAESVLEDVEQFVAPLNITRRAVHGSASGYGTPFPFDRTIAARHLGMEDIEYNTLHAQNTRGKLEAAVLHTLHQLASSVGRLATDLIHFSSEAYGFFSLPEKLTTGSSIMPQKRNPDVLELARALPATLLGQYAAITGTLHGLGQGYHRDLQRTKGPCLAALREVEALCHIFAQTLDELRCDAGKAQAAMRPEIYATDRAYAYVAAGLPFRDAYMRAKQEADVVLPDALQRRTALGSPGTGGYLEDRIDAAEELLAPYWQAHDTAAALVSPIP
jgi:argininosuccinate lyase